MERNGLAGLGIGEVKGGGGCWKRGRARTERSYYVATELLCAVAITTKLAKHEYPASNYYKIFR